MMARPRVALRRRARATWRRDRARQGRAAALMNRVARLIVWGARGLAIHGVSLQAAALTYYTVFAVVPVVAVGLWVIRALDALPLVTVNLPLSPRDSGAGDTLLAAAVRTIVAATERNGNASGIAGLVGLTFSVSRMALYVERGLGAIASSSRRPRLRRRVLGYLGLVLLPPTLLAMAGALAGALGVTSGAIPQVKALIAIAVVGGIVWLALSIFYFEVIWARLSFTSAAIGGATATVLLGAVLWTFATFQIGVSRANAVWSGMAALPVFMLWTFASWFVILLGAEIAVGHAVDRVAVHGIDHWRLDASGQQAVGLAVMIGAAHNVDGVVAVEATARELKVLPESLNQIVQRLVAFGFLAETTTDCYRLSCDLRGTRVLAIIGALGHDPTLPGVEGLVERLGPGPRELLRKWGGNDPGPTLAQLVAAGA